MKTMSPFYTSISVVPPYWCAAKIAHDAMGKPSWSLSALVAWATKLVEVESERGWLRWEVFCSPSGQQHAVDVISKCTRSLHMHRVWCVHWYADWNKGEYWHWTWKQLLRFQVIVCENGSSLHQFTSQILAVSGKHFLAPIDTRHRTSCEITSTPTWHCPTRKIIKKLNMSQLLISL